MKIKYMSDLHLEFHALPFPEKGEVLVLAGDITVKAHREWIDEVSKLFEVVLYVTGNHEYYRGDLTATLKKLRADLPDNMQILQNSSYSWKGVNFHGATLWTDCHNQNPVSMNVVENGLNDFRLIRTNDYKLRFTAKRMISEHLFSKYFLAENVKPGDVIVTHHAPTHLSVSPEFKNDYYMNGGFVNNLGELILDTKPSLWFHGHVHSNFDYMVGDTRVLCNPHGYHDENPSFDVNAEIEL